MGRVRRLEAPQSLGLTIVSDRPGHQQGHAAIGGAIGGPSRLFLQSA